LGRHRWLPGRSCRRASGQALSQRISPKRQRGKL
jgi:hypothetical protein